MVSRDFFRGPGRTNLHVALAKTKAITERVNTEFRAETFNMFNHTEFARKRRRGMGSLPSSQALLEEVGGSRRLLVKSRFIANNRPATK